MSILYKKSDNNGFTLIELLVVIAIIGILATLLLLQLNSSKQKARNAQRTATLKSLKTALEIYNIDNRGYPLGGWYSSEPGDGVGTNGGNWIPGLAPTYVPNLPRDIGGPIIPNCVGSPWIPAYLYISDGVSYKLLSHCSPEGDLPATHPFYDPVRPTWAWMVCSGGPACSGW